MICGALAGGGTEPTERKTRIIKEKVRPRRAKVNLVEIEVNPNKMKTVDMDSLIVGFSRQDFKWFLAPLMMTLYSKIHMFMTITWFIYWWTGEARSMSCYGIIPKD